MRNDEVDVRFGAVFRTLVYRDSVGEIIFTFDFGDDQQSLGTKTTVSEHHRPQDQESLRYRTAYRQTGKFLESCGYNVKYSDFAPTPSFTSAGIAEQLKKELATLKSPNQFGFDPAESLVPPAKAEFFGPEKWSLWVVLKQPATQLMIVFDEYSNQFGIAKDQTFLGFSGTFPQTLADVLRILK